MPVGGRLKIDAGSDGNRAGAAGRVERVRGRPILCIDHAACLGARRIAFIKAPGGELCHGDAKQTRERGRTERKENDERRVLSIRRYFGSVPRERKRVAIKKRRRCARRPSSFCLPLLFFCFFANHLNVEISSDSAS